MNWQKQFNKKVSKHLAKQSGRFGKMSALPRPKFCLTLQFRFARPSGSGSRHQASKTLAEAA